MDNRRRFWLLLALYAAFLLAIFISGGAWLLDRLTTESSQGALLAFLAASTFLLIAPLAIIWAYLDRALIHPLKSITRGVRIMQQANPNHQFEVPDYHLLGNLPSALHDLGVHIHQVNQEKSNALSAGAAAAQAQKRRLETVLTELSEGVLVCDHHARILLYNPAAMRILGENETLGLGRSLYSFMTKASLVYAYELLQARLDKEHEQARDDRDAELVCTTVDTLLRLHCRMRLLHADDNEKPGFVLAFSDVTRQIEALGQRDTLLRCVLDEFRRPLANLSAAGQNLIAFPEMDLPTRQSFQTIISEESTALGERLDKASHDSQTLVGSEWLMGDVYSLDLIPGIIRRLRDNLGPAATMTGLPLWMHADSHALTVMIVDLLKFIAADTTVDQFDIEALMGDRHVYLDLIWKGPPISNSQLDAWLDSPVNEVNSAAKLLDILTLHGGEIWCLQHPRPGFSLLRIPVPASNRQWQAPREALPARPEFYDFSMAVAAPGAMAQRLLHELEYVVFDTETTGLQPSQGDEIISIGAVRIVNGRILTGETFERLVNPGRPIPQSSIRFHGITDADVEDKPPVQQALQDFKAFVGDAVLVAHNGAFDMKFIHLKEAQCGVSFDNVVLDVLLLSVFLHDHTPDHTLDGTARRLGVEITNRHTAIGDAMVTAALFRQLCNLLPQRGVETLAQALEVSDQMLAVRKQQQY